MRLFARSFAIAAFGALALSANAGLTVTVESATEGGGFFFTPFWVALHNGEFDSYDGGTLASMWPGLTELAEGGDTGPIGAAFDLSPAGLAGGVDATILAVAFATDAPVFNPSESVRFFLETGDRKVNRWFSYASMVIPSNDLFVANGNPLAHEVFDDEGNFNGPIVIEILGGAVNDNGTEVNDAFGGAAFSANGGKGVDEKVLIRKFFTEEGDAEYLESFVGTETVTGFTITDPFMPKEVIVRIRIDLTPPATCPDDLNWDGDVDFDDLLRILTNWGPCPK